MIFFSFTLICMPAIDVRIALDVHMSIYAYRFFSSHLIPTKVFGNVRQDSGNTEINRHNNFANFFYALMLLFRYLSSLLLLFACFVSGGERERG